MIKDNELPNFLSTEKIHAKARRKFIGQALAASLARLQSPLKNSYAKSTVCTDIMMVDADQKLKSAYYCRARWCPTCQSIKMATMINKYLPELSKLSDLQFVTLTIPTVEDDQITDQVILMQKAWRKILDLARKLRSNFNGLRKTELKVSSRNHRSYHCHYHIILSGAENAEWLVSQWLRIFPSASKKAQDIRVVNELETALIELMKYTTKLTCSDNAGNEVTAKPYQLDIIFRALYGKRLYQAFGCLRAINEDDMEMSAEIIAKARGIYKWCGHDWWHTDYGQQLTNWNPDQEAIQLLRNLGQSYYKY